MDEMQTITEDKWDKEVWGAATSEGTNNRDTINSNLRVYWGKQVSLPHVCSTAYKSLNL